MIYYCYVFLVILLSASDFILALYDKCAAKSTAYRIPENTLIGISALGGCFGLLLGMLLFRHKTRKAKFFIITPLFCVAHGYLCYVSVMYILSNPLISLLATPK